MKTKYKMMNTKYKILITKYKIEHKTQNTKYKIQTTKCVEKEGGLHCVPVISSCLVGHECSHENTNPKE